MTEYRVAGRPLYERLGFAASEECMVMNLGLGE